MKKISVALSTYNHEKFIEQCIDSVLSDTYTNKEIIVVDAGSSDKTVSIIENKFAKYINLIKLQNSDPSSTLNRAIHQCNGDLIALLSGDDINLPYRLSSSSEYFYTNNCNVVFAKPKLINSDGKRIKLNIFPIIPINNGSDTKEIFLNLFNHGNLFCAPTALIDKKKLKKIGYFDQRFFQLQDYDLWLRMALNDWKFGYYNEEQVGYRLHDRNISHTRSHKIMFEEFPIVLYKNLSSKNNNLYSFFKKQLPSFESKIKLSEFDKHVILRNHKLLEVRQYAKWMLFNNFNEKDIMEYGFKNFNIAKYLNNY